MKYSLGLDIGSESIGWAVVELDDNDNPKKLIDMGVRTFDAVVGEQEQAETPAKIRRLARSARRRLRNKKRRKRKFIEKSIEIGLLHGKDEVEPILFSDPQNTPWKLRANGLDRLLSREEWFRVLYHILNHRGYKQVSRGEDSDALDEKKIMKFKAAELRKLWSSKGYRTVAEFFEKDEEWKKEKGSRRRNREGDYSFTVFRDDLIEEAKLLFQKQREFGNPFASESFEAAYLEILDEQPPIQEGDELKKLVGSCTFEPEEKRAPKATLTGQIFVALQKLNNLTIVNLETGEKIELTRQHLEKLIEKGLKSGKLTSKDILNVLGIEDGFIEGFSPAEVVVKFEHYQQLKRLLSKKYPEVWEMLVADEDLFNKVAEILTYYRTEKKTLEKLHEAGIDESAARELLGVTFKGHLSLSIKAMKKINKFLWEGYVYSDACSLAGYDHTKRIEGKNINNIPAFDSEDADPEIRRKFLSLTNPNVIRALTQARKVVNAIVREYGAPSRFVIELAREFALSREAKKEIQREQRMREKERNEAIEKIKEALGDSAKINEKLIQKVILYEQQAGKSAYSLKEIDFGRMLTDELYTEIDHIIPRSLSFDNSLANKVLVLADDNRNKGDQLAAPFIRKHFGEDHYRRFLEEFVDGILENTRRSKSHRFYEISKKIELLNKEEFTEEEKVRAQQRMLHATQYASSFFRQVLETYFKDSKVIPVTGKLVNEVRSLSGLGSLKRRGESDKHHAVDAAICAVCDYKIVKRMADYLRLRERTFRRNPNARIDFETNLIVPDEKVFEPYPGFRKDVEEKFEKILVSRMPRRKATGAGHRETILSLKHVLKNGVEVPEKGRVSLSSDGPRPTKRVRLDSLTESQIKEILKKPSPILVDEKSNWKLYEIIRKRLREVEPLVKDKKKWAEIAFGGEDGKIYMPTKDGGIGPEVKKIKIYTNDLSGIRVRGGIAENATLVRLDIYRKFSKKGKYQYFGSPVYAADIAMGYIPDKVADPNKPESEWPKIDNSFEFLCHVFRGDYLLIQKDESEKPMIICYRRFDRVNCRLIGDLPDRSNRMNGGRDIRISITNCFKIIKLHVDILGRAFFVEKEKKVY